MGIDYYNCHYCGESFPDVINYVCCDCGIHWCSRECAKKDKYKVNSKTDESSCKFCRGEDVEDDKLLKFALKKLRLNRKQLIEQYKIK